MAADHAVRTEGVPAISFWETILRREAKVIFEEDNESAIRVIVTGKSPTMRRVGRTRKVRLAWLRETLNNGQYDLRRCATDRVEADILIKYFASAATWVYACRLINHARLSKHLLGLEPVAAPAWEPKTERGREAMRRVGMSAAPPPFDDPPKNCAALLLPGFVGRPVR